MKARLPKRREFLIQFEKEDERTAECWGKLNQILEDYKKAHNGNSVFEPTFIEDCEPAVKKLQEEYGFTYSIEEK